MSVNVLCPNGRRLNVKVTPNTSVLQIIEEACKRHSFCSDSYNLKHLLRTLDITNTVRFANLPNNCQLELIETDKPRVAGNVTVNITTDTGLRLHAEEFPASSSLWEILCFYYNVPEEENNVRISLCPPKSGFEPIIVYSMRRIAGDDLHTITLKALGLAKGKCMFRYSTQRKSDKQPSQAHVSTPLTRPKPPIQSQVNNDEKPPTQSQVYNDEKPPTESQVNNDEKPALHSPTAGGKSTNEDMVVSSLSEVSPSCDLVLGQSSLSYDGKQQPQGTTQQQQQQPNIIPNMEVQSSHPSPGIRPNLIPDQGPDIVSSSQNSGVPDVVQSQASLEQPDVLAASSDVCSSAIDLVSSLQGGPSSTPVNNAPVSSSSAADIHPVSSVDSMDITNGAVNDVQEKVVPIGPRDAILFNQSDAPTTETNDEDDSFYELSMVEVRKIHNEYMREIKELEDRPLMTKGFREMEKQSRMLSALNQFPVTQLRICFPDLNVIQASFKPHDTIATVKDFLKPFLADPDMEFSLYSSFPREELDLSVTLVDAGCVPKARLDFSAKSLPTDYIRAETLSLKSSFKSATQSVVNAKPSVMNCVKDEGISVPKSKPFGNYSSSGASSSTTSAGSNQRNEGAQKKPKWFKLGK